MYTGTAKILPVFKKALQTNPHTYTPLYVNRFRSPSKASENEATTLLKCVLENFYNIDPNIEYLGYPNEEDSSLSSDDGDLADDDVNRDRYENGDNSDKNDNENNSGWYDEQAFRKKVW